jgi:ribulose-phosphate 3-epimerase
MTKKIIIAPSLLSLDFSNAKEQFVEINKSEAEWLHYDVMDGNFVPNISFGPYILNCFNKITDKIFDVHLMVEDPKYFAEVFIKEKPAYITFHYEAFNNKKDMVELAKYIKKNNIKAGISIKPNTPVYVLEDIIESFDLVLVMSVEPGFGGQKFNENVLEKITYLSKIIEYKKLDTLIQVDGGINQETAKKCVAAGADVLVAGSYVFKGDIVERISSLL